MKGFYVSLLVIVAIAVSVNAATVGGPQDECPTICTFDYRPVCGYDGECYHKYGNACSLRADRCENKQALKSVEMGLCEQALAKTNPEIVACKVE